MLQLDVQHQHSLHRLCSRVGKVRCSVVQPGHAWLSQHYKWALDRAFLEQGHSHVIIVEDDMLFSPDFLHFFEATAVLLERDPTLWCISTWNDNGLKTFDWDPMRMVGSLCIQYAPTINEHAHTPIALPRPNIGLDQLSR